MSTVTQGGMHTQASIDAETAALLEDAKKRNMVWDAEMQLDCTQTNNGTDNLTAHPTEPSHLNSNGLLGQKMEDGAVLPIGRYVSGKEAAQISHVGQLVPLISFLISNASLL
jgi:hypothetical protein